MMARAKAPATRAATGLLTDAAPVYCEGAGAEGEGLGAAGDGAGSGAAGYD
jgi:hypothetical protein